MSAEINSWVADFVARLQTLYIQLQYFFLQVVPWWAYPIAVGAVSVAIVLRKGVKKDVEVVEEAESSTPTAGEFLEKQEKIRQGMAGLEGQEDKNGKAVDDGHPVDVEDRLINALIDAVANSRIVKGSRLSLIIDPEASKKLSLGAGQIDFELGPSIPEGETKERTDMPPIPRDDRPEQEEIEATM